VYQSIIIKKLENEDANKIEIFAWYIYVKGVILIKNNWKYNV
jgi:hypothetical protein